MVTGKNVKTGAKPAASPAVKRAVKKPAARSAVKPGPKATSAIKPAAKAVVKPAVKPTVKPTVKATVKPQSKPLLVTKPLTAKPALPVSKSAPSIKSLPDVKAKVKKAKLVRDSFTMPADEYQVLGDVKKTFLKAGLEVKKSELLRVGVALIRELDLASLKLAVASLPPVKAGRPKKEK
ncbi:hypothetical protein SAMN04515620_10156 [Collimonas sp. OK607]|uniref:hypothetical protein n=1 Tax=Collimonas sp. OK607 TaxID=1798194 RepID=UPI0008F0CAF9|nr:hypothetical protein [Collimonas sp. OK607]SFA69048.1 hypothetical protein SAMN04515620_10156 [Collimonas sp. OK607]